MDVGFGLLILAVGFTGGYWVRRLLNMDISYRVYNQDIWGKHPVYDDDGTPTHGIFRKLRRRQRVDHERA